MAAVEKPGGGSLRGKTQGVVQPVFSKRLDDLKKQAQNLYQALQAVTQRKWQTPSDFKGDLLEIKTLHEPSFDRKAINTNYETATQDTETAGTNGDIISLKFQLDYVAGEERAFRHRHASLPRSICHLHGRRFGAGEGRMTKIIREEAERTIAAGGVK